jgi:hypothetical protein
MKLAVRQTVAVTCLVVCPRLAVAEWLDWSAAAELEVGHDDNLSIATDDFAEGDSHVALRAELARAFVLDRKGSANTRLLWSADLARAHYGDWDELSRTDIGAAVRLSHKTGLGLLAPRLHAVARAQYQSVRDGDRDAWHYSLQAGADKRLGPRLDLGIAAIYRIREGEQWSPASTDIGSRVYDSEHFEFSAVLRYSLHQRVRMVASASYYDGEFDSGCGDLLSAGGAGEYGTGPLRPDRDPGWRQYDLKALAVDALFACRLLADGDGYGARLDLNWSLSRVSSLRLGAGYRRIEMDLGKHYSNTVIGLSYRYQL